MAPLRAPLAATRDPHLAGRYLIFLDSMVLYDSTGRTSLRVWEEPVRPLTRLEVARHLAGFPVRYSTHRTPRG